MKIIIHHEYEALDCERCPKCNVWYVENSNHKCNQKFISSEKEDEKKDA